VNRPFRSLNSLLSTQHVGCWRRLVNVLCCLVICVLVNFPGHSLTVLYHSFSEPSSLSTGQAQFSRRSVRTSRRTGAASAPVSHVRLSYLDSPGGQGRPISSHASLLGTQLSASSLPSSPAAAALLTVHPPRTPTPTRRRSRSFGQNNMEEQPSPGNRARASPRSPSGRKLLNDSAAKAQSRDAQKVNDGMVYLDGPQVYTCGNCRTHLTSHDDIISKSFHGRHGRAYLFDQCVNVTIGPAEDRELITGLHTVCDIFCKRCKNLVGWTYQKAYASSQKYKEGKFIIEKINLHLEESDHYDIAPPAGERTDRWRKRSISWGSEPPGAPSAPGSTPIVYEYQPRP
jgi:hypothetical protein